jgi:hypothetical protein
MFAEVILDTWRDLDHVTAALIDEDYGVRLLDDWVDPCGGPHAWLIATKLSELDQSAFFTTSAGCVTTCAAVA